MIWQRPKPPTRAMIGQQRARLRFAWYPRTLTDYRRCWLERYIELWEVDYDYSFTPYLRSPKWALRGRYALGDDLPRPFMSPAFDQPFMGDT